MDSNFILIIAILIGGLIGFFFGKTQEKSNSSSSQARLEELNIVLQSEKQANTNKENKIQELNTSLQKYSNEKSRLEAEKQALEKSLEDKEKQIQEKAKTIQELPILFMKEFESISHKLLNTNSNQFKQESSQNLQQLLEPLKTQIVQLEKQAKQFEDKAQENIKESVSLKEQVQSLTEQSKSIGNEAHNLAEALRGNKKLLGNWGEVILERLLENSGLVKGQNFELQTSIRSDSEENKRYIPDCILQLPEDKQIIIDSKVSLNDYRAFCSSEDKEEQEKHLKAHIEAVKRHIKDLSTKNYQTAKGISSPEFVLMFMPVEPAYILTIQKEPNLLAESMQSNVVLVSSSNLLAIARTVATLWKQSNQRNNVLAIAKEGGKLYDKFCGFILDFEKAESSLKTLNASFDTAKKKLFEGQRESIVKSCQKLKDLGAETTKQIPQELLSQADE